jgi:hypothetical protein
MADLNQLAERYIATFNETDAAERKTLIGALYTDDAGYTDPRVQLSGPEQIDAFVAETQSAFPGYVFTLGGPVDAHHGQARFQWHATAPGESEPAYIGFDVIVAEDGRVRRVYGWLDKVPAA